MQTRARVREHTGHRPSGRWTGLKPEAALGPHCRPRAGAAQTVSESSLRQPRGQDKTLD